MPLSTFLGLAIAICDTLGRIHAANVIHKDIKPKNIFIRSEGDGDSELSTVIGDFDESFHRGDDLASKGFEPLMTTTQYANPHFLDCGATLDPGLEDDFQLFKEQDYFSFGMTILEIIKSQHPEEFDHELSNHSFWQIIELLNAESDPFVHEKDHLLNFLAAQPDTELRKAETLRSLLDCALNLDLKHRCYQFKELCSSL